MTIWEINRYILQGKLPLHVAVELSVPGVINDLWNLSLANEHNLANAIELLLLIRHHEQLVDRIRRLPGLRHIVSTFYPSTHQWSPESGNARSYAVYEVRNWVTGLIVFDETLQHSDSLMLLSRALRPLGPPSLDEIVAAAERQAELLRRAPSP
jgi:hypothetical protein